MASGVDCSEHPGIDPTSRKGSIPEVQMADPSLAESPPASDHVTPYDLDHGKIYLRLLDADAAGADWREVSQIVLGLAPGVTHEIGSLTACYPRSSWSM